MNGAPLPSDRSDEDSQRGESALQWARQQHLGAQIAASARAHRRRKRQFRQGLAGGVICLAILVGAVTYGPRASNNPTPNHPTRPLVVSTPLRQTLPDGSVVELKAGAKIQVDYSASVRRVLLTTGEAHFAVAKNKDIPFVVSAGSVEVRAVGTEFAVELSPQVVDVLVTEGRVAVERPGATAAPAPLALLEAGQAVAVELASTTPPVTIMLQEDQRKSRLAWRVPRAELSGTPLVEVVECFNRHGAVRLRLADPDLGALQLSGVLRLDSPQALLHVLKTDFGLKDERLEDGTILLRKP